MIYLDNGATSFPKPQGMIEAMQTCMSQYCGNPGRSGHNMSRRTGEEIYKARKAVGQVFNIHNPQQIVFTLNTTEALNLGIKGVLKRGDHVITTEMEHNSVLRPIKALEADGIEHTLVPCKTDGSLEVSDIEAAIRPNTRLIVCTKASNVTGTIMPTKAIGRMAKARNILFLVDGAQGAGHMEMDVEDLDMLAVPGHKGLLGPLGTGMLYIREGLEIATLMEGGNGIASKDIIQPRELPEGYEVGTVNAPGIIGLGYSAAFLHEIGVKVIEDYERQLTATLDEALRNMKGVTVYGPEDCRKKVGIVTFNIDQYGCEEVTSLLNDQHDIAVRGGYHCAGLAHKTIGTWDQGAVRVSVGPYNQAKEITAIIDAIHQITKSEPGQSPY